MKLFRRCLVLGLMASSASVALFADITGEFNITGILWPSGQFFQAHANDNVIPLDPTLPTSCFGDCFFGGFALGSSTSDPTLKVDLGGLSSGVGLDFGFNADGAGTIAQDFFNNSGQDFFQLEIIAKALSLSSTLADYTCDETDANRAFARCLVQVDPNSDAKVTFLLTGSPGIPTSTVPEPSTWVLLLTAGAAVAVGRRESSCGADRS